MNIHLQLANYITRYAPSKTKILAYLTKKWQENPEILLTEMWYNEDLMLDMWMRTFLNTGKWVFEIKQKLLNKGFVHEDIEKKLEKFSEEIHDWEIFRENISRKIAFKIQKWKSLQCIKQELIGKFPYFKEEIGELLQDFSDSSGLAKEIQKYQQKYNLANSNEKQKFFQAIMRKWFRYDEIRNFLESTEE